MVKTSPTEATPTEYAPSLLVLEATPTMSPPPLSLEVTPTKPVTSLLLEFVAIPIVVVGVALLVTVAVAVLLCGCVIKQQLAKKQMQLACGVPCDVDTALSPRHGNSIKVSSNVAYSHSGVATTLPPQHGDINVSSNVAYSHTGSMDLSRIGVVNVVSDITGNERVTDDIKLSTNSAYTHSHGGGIENDDEVYGGGGVENDDDDETEVYYSRIEDL